jgi:predicted nucleic acid-binding Zn ribbon protein
MDRAMIPPDLIERAGAGRVEDEIERRGIKLVGRVDRCGPCPQCGGKDRFSINVRKQVFLCRGCAARGNVIALVRFLDGCDFREAVECLTGERAPAPSRPAPAATDASRVTQQLLALQPFVFPAAKPKTDAPYKPSRDDSVKVSVRNFEKPLHQRYPCPECSSAVPMDYCTACRAEWNKRRHEEQVLINARQRKWYAQRQARLTTGKPPTPCVACGTVINSKRKDARFCSGACRQRAHRRALPQARAAADWVAKRLADIPPGVENKDLARTRAIARWPARADLFARKCDIDRAEACLIALAGLKREARNV